MNAPIYEQFNGTIGPGNLLALVRNTAPYYFSEPFLSLAKFAPGRIPEQAVPRLIEMGAHPYGWLDIILNAERLTPTSNPLTEDRLDYFALCMACHHATVATFIPTDVDSKIRGVLWQAREDPEARRQMFDFSLDAMKWDVRKISTRWSEFSGVGPVSGHNGEMLGVLGGALGCFLKHEDAEYVEKAAAAIDAEFKRECHEFNFVLHSVERVSGPFKNSCRSMNGPETRSTVHEVELLKLASSLTHNCGDMDQGISFWTQNERYTPYRLRFGRLAHENATPFDGTLQTAAALYKAIMASEGHRHYPLREVRALRSSPDFLLPLGPFLDRWGELLGSHRGLTVDDRAEVLAALLSGCKKIPGQVGYYRAISGFVRALSSPLDQLVKRMPASLRGELKNPEIKRHISLQQASWESSMRKRARAVLAGR